MRAAVRTLQDRRRSRRFTIGNVVAHGNFRECREPIMVCVWHTSLDAACVIVSPDIEIPDRFDLVIGDLSCPVEKVWRRSSLLGVKSAVGC